MRLDYTRTSKNNKIARCGDKQLMNLSVLKINQIFSNLRHQTSNPKIIATVNFQPEILGL